MCEISHIDFDAAAPPCYESPAGVRSAAAKSPPVRAGEGDGMKYSLNQFWTDIKVALVTAFTITLPAGFCLYLLASGKLSNEKNEQSLQIGSELNLPMRTHCPQETNSDPEYTSQ